MHRPADAIDEPAATAGADPIPNRTSPRRYDRPPYDDTWTRRQSASPAPPGGRTPISGSIVRDTKPVPAAPLSTAVPRRTCVLPSPLRNAAERYQRSRPIGRLRRSVGATGPDAAPAGNNPYPVRQAAITEPQLSAQGGRHRAGRLAQATRRRRRFGPPPLPPAARNTLRAAPQQYRAPAAPPGQYGPPPSMAQRPGARTRSEHHAGRSRRCAIRSPFRRRPIDPFTPLYPDPAVDMDVVLSEAQTGRLMLGVAVNSDAGLVGQILLDEQNFDWTRYPTSWDDFVSGRAWRGGGQRFRLEAAPGTEVQRYLASFNEPYLLDTPVSLGLSGSFFDRRYRDWDEQRIGGRVSLGYQWIENDLSTAIAYRGEDVKISNISIRPSPELTEVVGNNALHGFK